MISSLQRWIVPGFFLGYLLLGLWIVPDYGISWDEPLQRRHGIVATDYINRFLGIPAERHDPDYELETYEHRYYGLLFTTTCYKLERLLDLDTFREIHLLRHYAVFLLFWLGSLAFYLLLRHRFGDWRWALAGMLFLLLCPRIFAHSFFNVKDAVLVAAVMWAMYTMVRFLDNPSWKWALAHALTSALAVDVRIVAAIIPALTLGWLFLGAVSGKHPWKKGLLALAVYLPAFACLMVAGWPSLWENPVANLLEAYRVMGAYQWGGEVRLWGEFLHPISGLPWYYLPSWMLITIPVGVTLFFLFQTGRLLTARTAHRADWIVFSLFAAPVFLVLWKKSVLYDDWRQMYFVYPAYAFVALAGAEALHRQLRKKWIVPLILALSLGGSLAQMIRIHPNQQVYFNFLAGTHREGRFDQDYWGLAYKQALEELLERDTSNFITFCAYNYPAKANHDFLPMEKQARLIQVWGEWGAKYYLSNFRERNELNRFRNKAFPLFDPFFFVRAGNTPIIGVYHVEPYWERVKGKKGAWELNE